MADSQFLVLGTHLQGVFNSVIDAVNGKQPAEAGKGLSTNDFTTTLKNKLDGIAAGAEVNQNAFSNVSDGTSTLVADSKTDTLTIVGGGATTVTYDTANDKLTISSVNTTYSVGDGGLTQKNFTTTLYNKLNGIAAGAQVNNNDFGRVNVDGVELTSASAGATLTMNFTGIADATADAGSNTITVNVPDQSYSLPIATAAALGGVKVGSGLTINATTGVLALASGYATTSYVDTALANVIDAAPAALNTLNELAAALGDDANFATNVTTSLSAKVDSTYLGAAQDAIDVLGFGSGLNELN
jgi:hypothetical protein